MTAAQRAARASVSGRASPSRPTRSLTKPLRGSRLAPSLLYVELQNCSRGTPRLARLDEATYSLDAVWDQSEEHYMEVLFPVERVERAAAEFLRVRYGWSAKTVEEVVKENANHAFKMRDVLQGPGVKEDL